LQNAACLAALNGDPTTVTWAAIAAAYCSLCADDAAGAMSLATDALTGGGMLEEEPEIFKLPAWTRVCARLYRGEALCWLHRPEEAAQELQLATTELGLLSHSSTSGSVSHRWW
jgi:hypothetical protein